jgi:hypothetical protein
MLLALVGAAGCRGGPAPPPKPGPLVETYTVEARQHQLVAGDKQDVEITVRYLRSQQPATTLKYKVELAAPADLTVTPLSWDVEQNLTTKDGGINLSRLVTVGVAPDAAPGERDVTATVTPAQGAPSTTGLKFRVSKKGD